MVGNQRDSAAVQDSIRVSWPASDSCPADARGGILPLAGTDNNPYSPGAGELLHVLYGVVLAKGVGIADMNPQREVGETETAIGVGLDLSVVGQ